MGSRGGDGSLLSRSLGDVTKQYNDPDANKLARRLAGGQMSRNSPYARGESDAEQWRHDMYADAPARRPAAPAGAASRDRWEHAGGAPSSGPASRKLKITNLHYEVDEKSLEALLAQVGPISSGPSIKYDRSGRSEGVAWVTYEQEAHAIKARDAFDGAPAKNQPITVTFERLTARDADPSSLLSRLEGPSRRPPPPTRNSNDRFASSGGSARSERGIGSSSGSSRYADRGGERRGPPPPLGVGGRGGPRGDPRGARGGPSARGGGGEGRGAGRRAPKTEQDLDAELDAFMKGGSGGGAADNNNAGGDTSAAAPTQTQGSGEDVEMK